MIPSVFKSTRRAFLQLALAATVVAIVPAHLRAGDVDPSHWVIEADQARKFLAEGALLIDARGQDLKDDAPLQGAAAVIWQDFTNPDLPVKGRLLADDAALTAKLQGIGLSKGVPAVVVADSVNGCLRLDKPHRRTAGSLCDGFCVGRVILLPFHERLHVCGRDQPDLVAERADLTGPEMSYRTGFHSDDTRRQLRKESA